MSEMEWKTDQEYLDCVNDILTHRKFLQMDSYIQHGSTTTMEHCISVSYLSYKICKKLKFDYKSAARGALIHDLYLYDWHTYHEKYGKSFHGLTHPRVALKNARRFFKLNPIEEDIILKHMWPITIIPPKYKEGFVVMYADKQCGFWETMKKNKISHIQSV